MFFPPQKIKHPWKEGCYAGELLSKWEAHQFPGTPVVPKALAMP
jgi:hypothetical protein